MTRLAIRLAVLPVTLSAFASLVLALDWLSGGLPPWVAEGVWNNPVRLKPTLSAGGTSGTSATAVVALAMSLADIGSPQLKKALTAMHTPAPATAPCRNPRP